MGFFAPVLIALLLLAPSMQVAQAQALTHADALKAVSPAPGKLLLGVFPGGTTGAEDDITPAQVTSYERAVRHKVNWVYFSHNWYQGHAFPTSTAKWIRGRGAIPFVRLMMRSDNELFHREPTYSLTAIIRGDFDSDLTAWGAAAAQFKTPILAEFGTEMNGEWFPWSARWTNRQRGAARFATAYRHIIDQTRKAGASNIIWVFHPNYADSPPRRWNRMETYYPGNDYIDWFGVSVYSLLGPTETERADFTASLTAAVTRFTAMSPNKPIIIAEFGTDIHNPREPAAAWTGEALRNIIANRWPRVIGFSWWNETWPNDENPAHDSNLQVQASPPLAKVFRQHLRNNRMQ